MVEPILDQSFHLFVTLFEPSVHAVQPVFWHAQLEDLDDRLDDVAEKHRFDSYVEVVVAKRSLREAVEAGHILLVVVDHVPSCQERD